MHARSLGADSSRSAASPTGGRPRSCQSSPRTHVIVIETDPAISTGEGGAWWEVPVAEVASRGEVRQAHAAYAEALLRREQELTPQRISI
jgi:3D-(3,5/4)-trihydroxycyclohexane-1,2-dione acylhydrolase (decyclizing)